MRKKLTSRAILVPVGLAALAALALGLWFGAFGQQQAAATPPLEDLTVVVTSDPTSGTIMAEGSVVTYTVTVTADGQTTTANVPLDINLSGLTLIDATLSADTGITCTAGNPIDCTVTTVFAAAGSRDVTFQATVNAGGPALVGAVLDTPIDGTGAGVLTEEGNDAGAVDAGNADGDDGDDPGLNCTAVGEGTDNAPVEEPDNFDCTSHAVGTPDLTITKSANPTEDTAVPPGGTIIYTLSVSATGAAASNVVIRDKLGTGLTFYSVNGGTGVTCGSPSGQTADCTASTVVPGTNRTVTVVATVSASAGATVFEGAYVDPDDDITETNEDAGDPYLSCAAVGEGSDAGGASSEPDNFDCTAHSVGTSDLTITKSASPVDGSTVATGATITYTLIAANSASATGTASNVVIRDILGTGLTFGSITAGTGVTCSDTTGPYYDCTATSMAPGESRTVTVVATVSATSGAVLNGALVDPADNIDETNEDADDPDLSCAAVDEGSDAGDATEPDNFDCTSHTVGAGLDLTISKTATPTDGTSVSTGANITYTLSVSATGGTASNVVIRDTLGTGLTFVSITGGTGVTCADTTGPDYDCTASTVETGTNRTVTVVATVSATSGTVLNGARVDPGSAITETNEDADDPDLSCATVGEGTDTAPATEPDNFDCTSHTVGAAGTRTLDLSPAGWHSFVWTGASSTDPATALACLGTNYSIAYEWVGSTQSWLRYVPGHPEMSNITVVNKYDALLVLITTAVTCNMPI